ncbi:hypothetical protein FT663_01869 [Candidozyma haemuli var. vulneris]|uniref:L-xylulose reductase n=1 Tax=Candidozyma haemuli TaxID=45357 RepID=A0A2V1AMG5_9ASCO|nr:hypothetical protein CXQ85_003323 [[Candida] haemuloni]KAF3985372.1 hypothetical protein FT662_05186 [[Candida] haemuloni var. vulneris]KAF3993365.1 hypothetical protein FT663_01869 [[Candida] haemuloni var. vulneris]PVH19477.1 hypothetical protein CXQ85_003323 [[Candida] haemuloni]
MLFQPSEASIFKLFSLKDNVSLITGGARGIGLGAAIGLAEAGSDIAITYNSSKPDEVKKVEEIFQELGVRFKAYKCNVVNKKDIEACVNQVVSDFGRLDIVVPNAGVAVHQEAEKFTEENYHKTLSVNLDGAFFTAQAAANAFKKQKENSESFNQGRIVFTASISSSIVNYPQPQAPYNASKAAVVRLAKCLAVEWVDFARVNCVSPGYIATEMTDVHPEEWKKIWFSLIPAKRMCSVYELKGVYVFLASQASSYVTGEEVIVGGGYALL